MDWGTAIYMVKSLLNGFLPRRCELLAGLFAGRYTGGWVLEGLWGHIASGDRRYLLLLARAKVCLLLRLWRHMHIGQRTPMRCILRLRRPWRVKDALVARRQFRRQQHRVVGAHLLHLNRRLLQVKVHVEGQVSRVGAGLLGLVGWVHLLLGGGLLILVGFGCGLCVQLKILQWSQVITWMTRLLRHLGVASINIILSLKDYRTCFWQNKIKVPPATFKTPIYLFLSKKISIKTKAYALKCFCSKMLAITFFFLKNSLHCI